MFAHPRVIGRALEGDVEGQLHAVRPGGSDERSEVVTRAELRMDGVMTTLVRTDRPG